jgi:hypothetical protein
MIVSTNSKLMPGSHVFLRLLVRLYKLDLMEYVDSYPLMADIQETHRIVVRSNSSYSEEYEVRWRCDYIDHSFSQALSGVK